ncbi:MAG: penicillin-binding protein beta-lactamase class C [Ignavibacteria bacterium]|nr:MAG: penicillin-binding protein beta-lactamase class C [Ignavibacteria bacterium]
MKKITIMLFLVLSVITQSYLLAQSKAEKIDQLISKYNEYRYFNGSALVADNFDVVLKKGYGFANMEWNITNAADTKHRLGSITKQFTSMLIMQLVEKGKIKLDGKLTEYLPYYRKDIGDKITIEMLLTHTSGIPSYTAETDFLKNVSRKFYKPDDFVKEHCSGDLEFEPGKQYAYNNSGYFILGAIIEKLTGKGYEAVLRENIFEPLGMNNSGYDLAETILLKRAAGYQKTFDGYTNAPFLDMSLPYAAGSLYSTVEDLLVWDKALQTEKLLPKKFMDEIFKSRVEGLGAKYGYGWSLGKKKIGNEEYDVITHGGGINGFNTINYFIQKKGQVVILFSNAGGAPLNEMTEKIIDILNGKEVKMPAQSLAEHLVNVIKEDGVKDAVEQFKQMKEEKDAFVLRENEMNQLGYSLMNESKLDEAIAVFKLNVDEFPKSANVYDSYGEALLKKGNKEEAIVNYKKSLELNPRNTGAVKVLKENGVTVDEPKEIKLSAEILKQYVGKYQLAPNFIMAVTVNGEKIFVQATGQPQTEIFPLAEDKFYPKVVDAQIRFVKVNGIVNQLILTQNGREMPAKKIE